MCYCFVVHQRAALGHQVGQVHPTVQLQDPHRVPVHRPAVRAVPVLVQVQGLEPSAGMVHVSSGLVHVYHFLCVEHIVQYLLYQHNKSVHTCICMSVYVHIFLHYAFPWRNIYSCCFCPSPYHYFQSHRANTPVSLFAAPSSIPTLSVSVPCLSGVLLCPAAGSNKLLPDVTYPSKCTSHDPR